MREAFYGAVSLGILNFKGMTRFHTRKNWKKLYSDLKLCLDLFRLKIFCFSLMFLRQIPFHVSSIYLPLPIPISPNKGGPTYLLPFSAPFKES